MKISTCRTLIYRSVIALGVLLTVASASALTPTAPAGGNLPTAKAPPTQPLLTPAAPMTSPVFSAGEDIRDIRQPRHLPTHWFWAVIAAGVITLAAIAFGLRWWLYHGKFFQMRPHEIALQYLEEARELIDPDRAREYCFEVSKIIRRYIEERFNLQAPQLTTEEFLRELAESPEVLLASHRALLGDFLQHCDLAKFAGWYYCRPDLEAMHLSAVEFVRQTAANDPGAIRHRNSIAPAEPAMALNAGAVAKQNR
ncbi:MAG: DUF4381 family protein [Verrucomicrobiia bacterium]